MKKLKLGEVKLTEQPTGGTRLKIGPVHSPAHCTMRPPFPTKPGNSSSPVILVAGGSYILRKWIDRDPEQSPNPPILLPPGRANKNYSFTAAYLVIRI
jgi:hypothetical protein